MSSDRYAHKHPQLKNKCNLTELRYKELKTMCIKFGLSTSGLTSKKALIHVLKQHNSRSDPSFSSKTITTRRSRSYTTSNIETTVPDNPWRHLQRRKVSGQRQNGQSTDTHDINKDTAHQPRLFSPAPSTHKRYVENETPLPRHLHSHLKHQCNARGLFSHGTSQDLITRLLQDTETKCCASGCHCKRYVASRFQNAIDPCYFCTHSAQDHRAVLSPLSSFTNAPAFKYPSETNLVTKSNTLPMNDICNEAAQSLNIEITPQKENHPQNTHYKTHHHRTKTQPPKAQTNAFLAPLMMIQSETSLFRESSQETEETDEFEEIEFRHLRSKTVTSPHKRETFTVFNRQLKGLHDFVAKHNKLIDHETVKVDEYIQSLQKTEIAAVKKAKEKALNTEHKLMHEIIKDMHAMNAFLDDIILIENGFNKLYTEQEQKKQKEARRKWAKDIAKYENKERPTSKTESFIDLVFKGALYLSEFKEWLANLQRICQQKEINIVQTSGATAKNVDRSFYKAFFVYGGDFKQMTDMLRCSLVFDNFDDLYRCFHVIEDETRKNGGILRCKDKFDPKVVPFGYRDLLINIYCLEGDIVCEIQLHHQLFHQHKDVSHALYAKARLFDTKEGNLAYKYADKYIRQQMKCRVSPEMMNKDSLEPIQLLKQWKLEKYKDALMEEGWTDVAYWKGITKEALLKDMGFREGDAFKFIEKSKQIRSNN